MLDRAETPARRQKRQSPTPSLLRRSPPTRVYSPRIRCVVLRTALPSS